MAFGNIIDANPKTIETSDVGLVVAKLNQLFQMDNGDLKINLDFTSGGAHYIRYNKTNSHVEFYLNNVLEGYVDATGFHSI